MTPLVRANVPLALLFLLAWAGIPLRMVLRHLATELDYAAAHPYLAAKAALATGGKPETGCHCGLSSANGTREEPRADPAGDTTIPALASQRGRRRLPGVRRLPAASPMLLAAAGSRRQGSGTSPRPLTAHPKATGSTHLERFAARSVQEVRRDGKYTLCLATLS